MALFSVDADEVMGFLKLCVHSTPAFFSSAAIKEPYNMYVWFGCKVVKKTFQFLCFVTFTNGADLIVPHITMSLEVKEDQSFHRRIFFGSIVYILPFILKLWHISLILIRVDFVFVEA